MQAEERREVQNELHTRYGYCLFAEGEFDDAMAHFGMCSNANPLVLLHLFPSLAAPRLLQPLEETISGVPHDGLRKPPVAVISSVRVQVRQGWASSESRRNGWVATQRTLPSTTSDGSLLSRQ